MTTPEVANPEATTPAAVTILVLGPMRQDLNDAQVVVADARTVQLGQLVSAIAADLRTADPELSRIEVDEPGSNRSAAIIPGILAKIEAADLVILDLSGGSQNVMYELGLVNAVGLPYILTTKDDGPPFYMATIFCISDFAQIVPYNPQYAPHRLLRVRIRDFLLSLHDAHGDPNSFATNPVTDYFQGLPVVDISAPAGLAAGYWMNAVRRFVRLGGYFDRENMAVTFSRPDKTEFQQELSIGHLVVVEPVETLAETESRDRKLLESTLADYRYGMRKGVIPYVDPQDLRPFAGNFLGRVQPDGSFELVQPAIVIDMPTTLYALQYSPRVLRIGDNPLVRQDRALLTRLRRRRYYDMLDRFYRIMRYYMDRSDARGQDDHVHFVKLTQLPELLNSLVPGSSTA